MKKGAKKAQFGSLLINGHIVGSPQHPVCQEDGGDIQEYDGHSDIIIGDTVEGKTLTWIKPAGHNFYVCDRNLVNKISWDDLNVLKHISGRICIIDGRLYTCRVPSAHSSDNKSSEWRSIIQATSNRDATWHFRGMESWSQKGYSESSIYEEFKITVAAAAALNFNGRPRNQRHLGIGWRPILCPVSTGPFLSGKYVYLDGQLFQLDILCESPQEDGTWSIRLVLYPLQSIQTGGDFRLFPDPAPFRSAAQTKPLKMYSVTVDKDPISTQPSKGMPYSKGSAISITDAFFGMEYMAAWNIRDGIAFSSAPVLSGVTLEDLAAQGFNNPQSPTQIT